MEEKTEAKVRKPSFFLYTLPGLIIRPFIKLLWRHNYDNKAVRGLKSPVLAIANHSTTGDIVMTALTLLPKRYNIVTGKDVFSWPALRPFIKAFGAIPKSQCSVDIASMRLMKGAINQKRNILLYPEGKTTLDGKQSAHLGSGVGKFIKFLGCTVVMVKTHGGHLMHPRYAKGVRKGKVVSKAYVLFTDEETRTLSAEDINRRVEKAFEYNDHRWQRENGIRFKSKAPAARLEFILYKCPKCGAEYENYTDDRHIICKKCGNRVEYTEYGFLVPDEGSLTFDRIDLWCDYERKAARKELLADDFHISKPCKLLVNYSGEKEFIERGKGECYIDGESIGFKGLKEGEAFEIGQCLKCTPTIITKNGEGVDFTVGGDIYRCMFTEKKWSTKYLFLVEENFALKNARQAENPCQTSAGVV